MRAVAYSPDGRLVASGSDDGTVLLWDVQSREVVRTLGRDLSFSDAERGLTLGRRVGQLPRVFYRREPSPQPLVVAPPPAGR